MRKTKIFILLLAPLLLAAALPALASQCVDCHTDAERLKAIAEKLPEPETSSETAGKG